MSKARTVSARKMFIRMVAVDWMAISLMVEPRWAADGR